MQTVTTLAAQGDVLFRRIDSLPADVVEQRRNGRLVVAHSETGHHHAVDDPAVKLFERATRDELVGILDSPALASHAVNALNALGIEPKQGDWDYEAAAAEPPAGEVSDARKAREMLLNELYQRPEFRDCAATARKVFADAYDAGHNAGRSSRDAEVAELVQRAINAEVGQEDALRQELEAEKAAHERHLVELRNAQDKLKTLAGRLLDARHDHAEAQKARAVPSCAAAFYGRGCEASAVAGSIFCEGHAATEPIRVREKVRTLAEATFATWRKDGGDGRTSVDVATDIASEVFAQLFASPPASPDNTPPVYYRAPDTGNVERAPSLDNTPPEPLPDVLPAGTRVRSRCGYHHGVAIRTLALHRGVDEPYYVGAVRWDVGSVSELGEHWTLEHIDWAQWHSQQNQDSGTTAPASTDGPHAPQAASVADERGAVVSGTVVHRWQCPDCGTGVAADEDGCCATCGRDCQHVAVSVESPDAGLLEAVKAEIAQLRAEVDELGKMFKELHSSVGDAVADAETRQNGLGVTQVEQQKRLDEIEKHVAELRDTSLIASDSALDRETRERLDALELQGNSPAMCDVTANRVLDSVEQLAGKLHDEWGIESRVSELEILVRATRCAVDHLFSFGMHTVTPADLEREERDRAGKAQGA